jgi:putative ABC transport system ATP-binding protein
MPLIVAEDVSKEYKLDKTVSSALSGVSLEIGAGERVCLMGPSGSGKSTLLNLIGCIDRLTAGRLSVDGRDVSQMPDAALSVFRNRTMGFIFQSFNLIPVLSVFENVEYPLLMQNIGKNERKGRVMELLERVGLADFARRGPEKLSGGQRQRVAIARALVTKPRLVLADEPTAALDHKTGTTVMELMAQMNEREGATLIFSTHDPGVAQYAARIVRMQDGRIEAAP